MPDETGCIVKTAWRGVPWTEEEREEQRQEMVIANNKKFITSEINFLI